MTTAASTGTTPSTGPSTGPQQDTVQAILDHHAQLGRTMADHTLTISRSADRLMPPAERQALLIEFCTAEVLPHAAAEETTLYRAAAELPAAEPLVRAMVREHLILRDLTGALEEARTPGEITAAAGALNALFQAHLEKENDILLPLLVEAGTDLTALLDGMHEVLGGGQAGCGGHCTCGGHDDPGTPGASAEVVDGELDVRSLVPAQRHEQIFAAYGALAPGAAFVLVNDHDPKPLYYQFAAEHTGRFTWDYLESGPQVWRVRIGRP